MRDIRWIDRAEQVEENYGTLVDYTERFYICPECGEPVYEDELNKQAAETVSVEERTAAALEMLAIEGLPDAE